MAGTPGMGSPLDLDTHLVISSPWERARTARSTTRHLILDHGLATAVPGIHPCSLY